MRRSRDRRVKERVMRENKSGMIDRDRGYCQPLLIYAWWEKHVHICYPPQQWMMSWFDLDTTTFVDVVIFFFRILLVEIYAHRTVICCSIEIVNIWTNERANEIKWIELNFILLRRVRYTDCTTPGVKCACCRREISDCELLPPVCARCRAVSMLNALCMIWYWCRKPFSH